MRLLISLPGLLVPLLACNTLLPPRPDIQWDAASASPVIAADTCCGMVYDPNGIPDAQLWGDGRIVWVEYDGAQRRVLGARLSNAEMRSLLQSFVDAGFFGWRDHYAPAGPIYDAPSTCIRIRLAGASKSVCETLQGAPRRFGELYAALASGAGAPGIDYVPSSGYLQAVLNPELEASATAVEWPAEITGLSLQEIGGGVWLEGEALKTAWEIVNGEPLLPIVQEGDQFYTFTLLIPDLTRSAPGVQAPAAPPSTTP